ncbi:hypothetical protein [Halalkalicoccus salilacus]|uniref:hypothetical protein n=1 Tax=Halalkalicoccus salilacus TaxID=3117459 RepID=UPI00300F01F1
MYEESMTVISDPDGDERPPYLSPETLPAVSTTPNETAYTCGECGTQLAELAEGLHPEFAIVCPDCESFNAFPSA